MDLNSLEYKNLLIELEEYIAQNYIDPKERCICASIRPMPMALPKSRSAECRDILPSWLRKSQKKELGSNPEVVEEICASNDEAEFYEQESSVCVEDKLAPVASLEELLHLEEQTFSEKLFELIDEKKLEDVQVYQAANLDRKLFSKLRRKNYQPSKNTVLALIVGMQLNLEEAKELLTYAGFALAPSNKTDIIVSFFLEKGQKFDIFVINDALLKMGQKALGNSIE